MMHVCAYKMIGFAYQKMFPSDVKRYEFTIAAIAAIIR